MSSNSPDMLHSEHLHAAFWSFSSDGRAIKLDPVTGSSDFQTSPSTDSRPNKRNQGGGCGRTSCKKRKVDQTQNPKDVAEEESKMTVQNSKSSTVTSNSTATNNRGRSQAAEPPKTDYIHVRARRGQATDSHSLAERVRREKISQRMKYLQDLVPGCSNRITGKAGMLDEIINYVQSLQRQVEFLSMKLAAVNPTLDLKVDDYLAKEMFPACLPTIGPTSHMVNPANVQVNTLNQEVPGPSLEMGVNPKDVALISRAISAPVSIPDAFLDSCLNQIQHLTWEDELQNLYYMECLQGRPSTQTLPASVGFPNQD